MAETKTKESEKQGLINLKTVFNIQRNGVLQNMLRDLRSVKNQIDDFSQKVSKSIRNREQVRLEAEKSAVLKKQENKIETVADAGAKAQVQKQTADKSQSTQPKEQYQTKRVFDNTANNNRQGFKNGMNNRQNSNFSDYKKQFNRDAGNRFNNNNRPTTSNSNQQPFRNGQFQRRPGTFNKTGTYNKSNDSIFLSSKGNAFRSFTPASEALAGKDSRTAFANNKAKSAQRPSYDDRKPLNKRALLRKNLIGDDVIDYDGDGVRMGSRKQFKNQRKEETIIAPRIENAVITTANISVKDLSEKTGRPVSDIIKQLMILGVMATINSTIDFQTAELVCGELGVKLEQKLEKTYEEKLEEFSQEVNEKNLVARPPVVTVMGHVDHGKTSLLDVIRRTNVVGGEAGGITQKIGAYQIEYNGEKITFIDTPGHAAFTAMRARGAKVTDIAVLVVAADDGIMPQTIEAINHIKAANVPMIVAINKMDKPEANPERVKQQLAEQGVLPEDWGGDAILVPVSAKNNVGIDKLLDNILLVAEMQELKADPTQMAVGSVLEAELDKNRGPIATVLVQTGTLRVGDSIMSGITYGKVKAMYDENGKIVKSAGPSTPVSVLGLNEVPNSGDQVYAVSEKLSKQVIEERITKIKEERAKSTSGVTLDDFMDRVNEGKLKALNIIIKADIQGSVEALKQSLTAIRNDEARVVCIHSGAGPVTESDVVLAQASNAVIINFNLKINNKVESLAETLKVQIKSYKIIYEVIEEITDVINGMRAKVYEDKVIGKAEVLMMFKLSTSGIVCGCMVRDGKVARNAYVNVYRKDEKILETKIDALKIQKDDKAEVGYGYECGIKLNDATGVQVGDIIEAYEKVEVKR